MTLDGAIPGGMSAGPGVPPLLCFCHLRWDFVFQRPQHLMGRFASTRPVFVWEEPEWKDGGPAELAERREAASGVVVAVPRLDWRLDEEGRRAALRGLLDLFVARHGLERAVHWYYTPQMLPFSRHLAPAAVVYDCMDELSAFAFASPDLPALEAELLGRADLVFTGGRSLYAAKQERHPSVHCFPSGVDVAHFGGARHPQPEPADQADLPHPRLGFFGVVDERMDLALVDALAAARPDWTLVMLGPVAKIDAEALPKRANLHWLGRKEYRELPAYLAGWDAALMPFARNGATRFISPTKTPEYLAGGRPVVSTGIADVVADYGALRGVRIADTAEGFVAACAEALALDPADWLAQADARLAAGSWDATFRNMAALLAAAVAAKRPPVPVPAVRTAGRRRPFDDLVVGAGFAGAVMAERLAAGSRRRVLVVDRRPHVGGNAFDHRDRAGLLVHRYGPHIFHTNSDEIFAYLSRFTRWRPYEHRVLADLGQGRQVPMPINRTTLNALFGAGLGGDAEAAAFLARRAEPVADIRTAEDVVVSAVGRELYELFFRGYTRKQWGLDPSALDRSVTARVPTRTDTDDRYFTDRHQAMPADGYTALFERMLDHPRITVETGADFDDVRGEDAFERVVYTGPIDDYYGRRFGPLPYRSLRFEHRTLDRPRFQAVGTVNYPDEAVPYTRVTEYKHLTGQHHPRTSITLEYPCSEGDPYYPVPRPENQALYKRYEALARAEPDTVFVGRLASYRYYNMDQVVGQALATWRRLGGAAAEHPAPAHPQTAAALPPRA